MTQISDATDSISIAQDDMSDLSLGIKELIFLAIIFVFGFSGFGICVEKIYAANPEVKQEIESVIVHEEEASIISASRNSKGYAVQ